LTSSTKSIINTYLESDGLPVPESSWGQATPLPTKTKIQIDPAKNMNIPLTETI